MPSGYDTQSLDAYRSLLYSSTARILEFFPLNVPTHKRFLKTIGTRPWTIEVEQPAPLVSKIERVILLGD